MSTDWLHVWAWPPQVHTGRTRALGAFSPAEETDALGQWAGGHVGDPTRTGGPAEASGGKSEGDELGESPQGGDGNPGAGTGHMKTLL